MMSSVSLRRSVRSGVRKKFFTSCCVMVLPPCIRLEPTLSAARAMLRSEKPAWVK